MENAEPYAAIASRLFEVTRFVRLSKQQWLHDRPDVPIGLVSGLALIDSRGGCHAKELASRSGLDPSTVSRAVAAMVGHGLVQRRVDPADRRASSLVVTDTGHEVLAEARTWFLDLLRRALADWRPDEVEAFALALARFLVAVHQELEAAR